MNINAGSELFLEPVFACGECEFPSFRFMQYSASDPQLQDKTSTPQPKDTFKQHKKTHSRRRTYPSKG